MIRIHIFCEGKTEARFVDMVLKEYFSDKSIFLSASMLRTSKHAKGGVVSYLKIKREIELFCRRDRGVWVTTLIDFYGFSGKSFPKTGMPKSQNPIENVEAMEEAFKLDISKLNFIPYLIAHEFEGLLFSDPQEFKLDFGDTVVEKLLKIRNKYKTPEHINDSYETAPSRRIQKICGRKFPKTTVGVNIARRIGLPKIRKKCPHFNGWIERLEALKA